MNNDNLQTQCNSCGRPMAYCSCGGCNKCSGINFCEYGDKKCGCIRNQKPECPYTAVIPSVTVEDVSNIKDLADCFVHVSKINTTFYIDDKHRITSVWQGPVELSNYDIEENPLNLRSQFLLDYETGYVVYFNAQGEPMNLNDIDAIVERLEPELQEKINNKLDQMVEDGSFDVILSKYFVKDQNSPITLELFNRDCTEFISGITSESETEPIKGYIQGMTTTPSSIIYAVQGEGSYGRLNKAYLVEISKSTGSVIKEAFIEIYHANSMTFNPDTNEVIVASGSKYVDGQSVLEYSVVVVDYDTFTVKDTITVSQDIINSLGVVSSVSYNDGKYYLANGEKVIEVEDWTSITKTINLDTSVSGTPSLQETKVFGNNIYKMCFAPNGIQVFTLSGDYIRSLYDFDTDFPIEIGEMESIAIEESGDCYISSTQNISTRGYRCRLLDRTIWKTNIFHNGTKKYHISDLGNADITLRVDPTTTNKLQYGTSDKPFKHIQQAIMYAESCKNNTIKIILTKDTNYGFVVCRTNKDIEITVSSSASIYCGYFSGVHSISIYGVKFNLKDVIVDASNNKNLVFEDSNVKLSGCEISSETTLDYGVKNNGSNIKFASCTFKNLTDAIQNGNLSEITLYAPTWTSIINKFFNKGSVVINWDDSGVFNSCKLSDGGVLPINHCCKQNVSYTYSNNVVTVSTLSSSQMGKFAFQVRFHVRTSDNKEFWFLVPTNSTSSRHVINVVDGTNIYNFNYFLNYSGNTLTLSPKLFKINTTDGSYTETSVSLQEVSSVQVL